jgi:hypothetical protein
MIFSNGSTGWPHGFRALFCDGSGDCPSPVKSLGVGVSTSSSKATFLDLFDVAGMFADGQRVGDLVRSVFVGVQVCLLR